MTPDMNDAKPIRLKSNGTEYILVEKYDKLLNAAQMMLNAVKITQIPAGRIPEISVAFQILDMVVRDTYILVKDSQT